MKELLAGNAIFVYDLLRHYGIATVHFGIRNIVSSKNECHFVPIRILNVFTIHKCMQWKIRDLLTKIRSLPNKLTMCVQTLWQWRVKS